MTLILLLFILVIWETKRQKFSFIQVRRVVVSKNLKLLINTK
jgi:hypothetical protein